MGYQGSETSGDHGCHDLDFNYHPVDPAVIPGTRGVIKKLQNHLFGGRQGEDTHAVRRQHSRIKKVVRRSHPYSDRDRGGCRHPSACDLGPCECISSWSSRRCDRAALVSFGCRRWPATGGWRNCAGTYAALRASGFPPRPRRVSPLSERRNRAHGSVDASPSPQHRTVASRGRTTAR